MSLSATQYLFVLWSYHPPYDLDAKLVIFASVADNINMVGTLLICDDKVIIRGNTSNYHYCC